MLTIINTCTSTRGIQSTGNAIVAIVYICLSWTLLFKKHFVSVFTIKPNKVSSNVDRKCNNLLLIRMLVVNKSFKTWQDSWKTSWQMSHLIPLDVVYLIVKSRLAERGGWGDLISRGRDWRAPVANVSESEASAVKTRWHTRGGGWKKIKMVLFVYDLILMNVRNHPQKQALRYLVCFNLSIRFLTGWKLYYLVIWGNYMYLKLMKLNNSVSQTNFILKKLRLIWF